jgi:ABC-type polysaccharide/polyol phosphate transport system ATPase subunit
MSVAISFDGVSKHYRGATGSYAVLRDDVTDLLRGVMRRQRRSRGTIHALDEVSFEIEEGSSVAIVGLNGAGKTTALKVMTRITYPTAGVVRVRGRVGALLEVGTGMHPELTGRENISLYGRILGLSGRDIAERYDDIVEFAGIGGAIDQPVKQYSSGMQLRLGFSVAAHLEPDILLVDEAIAVGDAGFQYRCVERMSQLVREGRTLVFVSHDMSAIEALCDRAVLLSGGRLISDGPARDVVQQYIEAVQRQQVASDVAGAVAGEDLEIVRVTIHDAHGRQVERVMTDEAMTVRLHYHAHTPIRRPIFSVGLSDGGRACFTMASMLMDGNVPEVISGEGHVDCTFAQLPLQPRAYEVWGEVIGEHGFGGIVDWQRLRLFQVDGDLPAGKSGVTHTLTDAPVKIPYSWSVTGDGTPRG